MIHDPDLLDFLSKIESFEFSGDVYRATRKSLDPLAPSTSGGRWMPRGENSVLYTSLTKEGAIAELVFHWGMLDPLPSKPAAVTKLSVKIGQTISLKRDDLATLGINKAKYQQTEYEKMQKIGAAAAFIGCHGLIVPSARWESGNLIMFPENFDKNCEVTGSFKKEVNWRRWGKKNGLLD